MTACIGLLGGSFDPVHRGHLHIAQALLSGLPFSRLDFMPCYLPPHRTPLVATPWQRLTLLKRTLADTNQPKLGINTQELERKGVSYTVDTLRAIRQKDKTTPYALIISTEAWQQFHTWWEWSVLPTLAHLVIVDRPGYAFQWPSMPLPLQQLIAEYQTNNIDNLLEETYGNLLYFKLKKELSISATSIREGLKGGEVNCKNKAVYLQALSYLTPSAACYIINESIYS